MLLKQYLQNIGLDDKEAEIYLAGLQLGPSSIQDIAHQSGVKRSTVYEIMPDLIEKGLFNKTESNKKRLFVPQEPDNLLLYLKQKEKILSQIMPELESLKNTHATKPAVRIFEGLGGLKLIYEDMIKKPGEITAMAAPKNKIAPALLDYLRNDWEPRRINSQIPIKRININNTGNPNKTNRTVDKVGELEQILYLDEDDYPFTTGIYVYRMKIAFVSYNEKEMVGIVIRSAALVTTFRMLSKMLWSKSIRQNFSSYSS